MASAATKYGTMTNYNNGDDDGDDDGNEDGNNEKMPLPDTDPMVRYLIQSQSFSLTEEDWATTATAMRLHEHYISNLLKMHHQLLYVKFGFLDWYCCHMKKPPVQLIR